jgi:type IV pilus assembly protein PilB
MKKIINKQLGELLIDNKLITRENLEEALRVQKEKGGLIGQILVALNFTTEEAIAQALTAQYGFPYLPLSNYEIDPVVVRIVPEQVARQYGIIAVDRVGNILTIVMSNPLNQQAIEDVEMTTKLSMQIFVSTVSDINKAINQNYKA